MSSLVALIREEIRANPEAARKLVADLMQAAPELLPALDTMPAMLTVREAAAKAKVSEKTIRRKIEAGELHAARVGTRIRVSADELHRYLASSAARDPHQTPQHRPRHAAAGSSPVAAAFRRLGKF